MGILSTSSLPATRVLSRLLRSVILCGIALGALLGTMESRAQSSKENAIKAAFLYNFIKYVEWPSAGWPSKQITLCVVGDNPFGEALQQVLHGKFVHGRKLVVRESPSINDVDSCQILFISPSERQRLGSILNKVRNSSVLTVSEMRDFADLGGMINFVAERNKVRFEINNRAAGQRGLTISSQLLKLAKRVTQ